MAPRRRPAGLLLTPGAGSDASHHTLVAIEEALAPLPVAPRQRLAVLPRPERDRESTLVNDPAGALPLSGFRGASGSGDDDEGGGAKGRLPGGGA